MITFLAVTVLTTLSQLPAEYHIDCSSWGGKGRTEVKVRFTGADGTRVAFDMELLPGSTGESAREQIELPFANAGWRTRTIGKTILVVEGPKRGGVRSAEILSDGWKPEVRWVPLPPKKK